MKKSAVSLVVLLLISASAFAVVCEDRNPAPFRDGANTTFQTWTFDTNANPAAPTDVANPYGNPWIDVADYSQGSYWVANDMGHQGVWAVGKGRNGDLGDMVINIQNDPTLREEKKIWIQIVYSSLGGKEPMIGIKATDPQAPYAVIDLLPQYTQVLDNYYSYAVYSGTIRPNPKFESIFIRPRDCQVFVDCISVETQCIPEPMTMALLGLGSLLLRRRIA